MSLIISNKEITKDYFDYVGINQSSLKELEKGLDKYKENLEKKTEKSKSLIIGSLVDFLLLSNLEEFEDIYYISNLEKLPSDTQKKITEFVFEEIKDTVTEKNELKDYSNIIVTATEKINWQLNWGKTARFNKIVKDCSLYFKELLKSKDKIIISKNEYLLAQKISESLKTNSLTEKYFDREKLDKSEIQVFYQLPIFFRYRNYPCKALLDIVFICRDKDTNKVERIEIFDLKTIGDTVENFEKNVFKYRYDIQAAFYIEAVSNLFDVTLEKISFSFIVESTVYIGNPKVFHTTESFINRGRNGVKSVYYKDNILIKKKVKGFQELIDEYFFYVETSWKTGKLSAENKTLTLDENGIKEKL